MERLHYIEEAVFDIPEQYLECENVKVYDNRYRKRGVYQKSEREILWVDNKKLKWTSVK